MARMHNYYAGPAALPLQAIEATRDELLDFQKSGVSVMETSHRSKEYDQIHNETISLLKELMGLGDNFKVLFLGGGASLQFAMVPMNFLSAGKSADYILTGAWSKKAIKEAKILGTPRVAATTEKDGVFRTIPKQQDLSLDPNAVYCHLTSNNTIFGTQWRQFPHTGSVPLVADMSSDMLSRWVNVPKFGAIFAGAQKNLGPAGLTVVILRKDLAGRAPATLPTMLKYSTHMADKSCYNTPPVFAIYVMGLVLEWVKSQGGLSAIEQVNNAKAASLYERIDATDFYAGTCEPADRSKMNVTFRIHREELEEKFVKEAAAQGLVGLKGHRSVGGMRASLYNAMPLAGVSALIDFMTAFEEKHR